MQFFSDQVSLRQTLGKALIDSRGHPAHPQLVQQPGRHDTASEEQDAKPCRLEPGGRKSKTLQRPCFVPNAVVVAGRYPEPVTSRTEFGVVRLAPYSRILPLTVDAFELIAKEHALRDRQAQGCVVNLEILGIFG